MPCIHALCALHAKVAKIAIYTKINELTFFKSYEIAPQFQLRIFFIARNLSHTTR